jgi:glycosyltransferase involved in cell wall biosynthesis
MIGEALAAIARQSMPPFEVVVVDDGSTDDSIARLNALAAELPWLRFHRHDRNRGVNAAANTGLDIVRGDFVLFSAADDCLDADMIARASAAAAAFPHAGIVFSDQAEMGIDGGSRRIAPLDLPRTRRFFTGVEFVHLMQRNFFYFHVSSVWFEVGLLRALGGFPPVMKWHGDLFAAYVAGFERGAVYVPDAVSYVRVSPATYGASGKRGGGQPDVLRAWLAVTRQPGWEQRRAALVAAAIWPDFSLCGLRVLGEDPGYLSWRLIGRIVWFASWNPLALLLGAGLRRRLRAIRSRYRRWRAS